jgi:aldose 1-epimerase
MKISKRCFGVLSDGRKVQLYTLKAGDLTLSLSSLGAAWTSLLVPSRRGEEDILLGFSTLQGYAQKNPFFGATVGRFANRIGGARFTLEGAAFSLYKNDGGHSLHGGRRGFDKRLWKAEAYEERDGVFVRFELKSPPGDEGYPGALKAAVSYGLSKTNELIVSYEAAPDAPCPVNLTNHSYFNLAGEGSGDILSHELILRAPSYLEVGADLIPTGNILPVDGGPFDFRSRKPMGRDRPEGYDHCFVVEGTPGELRPCAEVFEGVSGRSMRVFTTQPGVQFYTGNQLTPLPGKAGSVYAKHGGFCLETQHFPDSPNQKGFPSAIFGPGRAYREKAVFSFDWE